MVRARLRILVRAVLLFVIGGALTAAGTPIVVILHVYGVLFVAALPFLAWRPRRLLITAAAWAVVSPVAVWLLRTWLLGTDTPVSNEAGLVDVAVSGSYPALTWMVFVLLGLAIGRCDLTHGPTRLRLAGCGALASVIGYASAWVATTVVGRGSSAMTCTPLASKSGIELSDLNGLAGGLKTETCLPTDGHPWQSLFTADPHSGTTFEILGSGGVAVAVIGMLLLIPTPHKARLALTPLTALGSMTLTIYVCHAISMYWLLGWSLDQSNSATLAAFVWSVATAAVFTTVWTLTLGAGPLERAVTWVTRQAAQPRRSPTTERG